MGRAAWLETSVPKPDHAADPPSPRALAFGNHQRAQLPGWPEGHARVPGSCAGNQQRAQHLLAATRVHPPVADEAITRAARDLRAHVCGPGANPDTHRAALRILLEQQHQLAAVLAAFRSLHGVQFVDVVATHLRGCTQLAAMEYLAAGTMRPAARVLAELIAPRPTRTGLWAALVDAHAAGNVDAEWRDVVTSGAPVVQRWATMNIRDAFSATLTPWDQAHALALLDAGELRPHHRIRVAIVGVGTVDHEVVAALREGSAATTAADYRREYGASLEDVLLDPVMGELGGIAAAQVRVLLGTPDMSPNALCDLLDVAAQVPGRSDGLWPCIEEALQRSTRPPLGQAYAEQVRRLTAHFLEVRREPTCVLSAYALGRLSALLNVAEDADAAGLPPDLGTDPARDDRYTAILADPTVRALRAAGGVDRGSVMPTLLEADRVQLTAWSTAYKHASEFRWYVQQNVLSHQVTPVGAVLCGTAVQRLAHVADGRITSGSYAAHAVRLASDHELDELRAALRAVYARAAARPKDGALPEEGRTTRLMQELADKLSRADLTLLNEALFVRTGDAIQDARDTLQVSAMESDSAFASVGALDLAALELEVALTRAELGDADAHASLVAHTDRARVVTHAMTTDRERTAAYVAIGANLAITIAATAATGGGALVAAATAGLGSLATQSIVTGRAAGLTPADLHEAANEALLSGASAGLFAAAAVHVAEQRAIAASLRATQDAGAIREAAELARWADLLETAAKAAEPTADAAIGALSDDEAWDGMSLDITSLAQSIIKDAGLDLATGALGDHASRHVAERLPDLGPGVADVAGSTSSATARAYARLVDANRAEEQ